MSHHLFAYLALGRLHKPRGTFLLLWPTWAALLIVYDGQVPWCMLLFFTTAVLLARTFGCIINDWADQSFDRLVKRTKDRPLAAGHLTDRQALLFFLLVAFAGLLLLVQLNVSAMFMCFVTVVLGALYPFSKRFFFVRSWC